MLPPLDVVEADETYYGRTKEKKALSQFRLMQSRVLMSAFAVAFGVKQTSLRVAKCLVMALTRHQLVHCTRPLSGVKRT
jgi:hypothetical protein